MADRVKCVIGIDGGASSTRAALISEGLTIIAEGAGGPADHFSVDSGKERLAESLSEAVSPLVARLAERPELALDAVCLGLTGISIPGKEQAAAEILAGMFAGVETAAQATLEAPVGTSAETRVQITIESDALAAWAGAFAGKDGVIVIGGTGSVAYGRMGDRETRRGGFGYLFGDEGSGFRVACDAIRAALDDHDGLGPGTSLGGVVRDFFGVQSVRQVPGKVYSENVPVEEIAAMCPLVFREAARGDGVARCIVSEAGRSLGRLAAAALKALGGRKGTVSYAGGVFQAGDAILGPFRKEIARVFPDAVVVPPKYSPLVGAGILAWKRSAGEGI